VIDFFQYDVLSYRMFGAKTSKKKSAYSELENVLSKANMFVPVDVYLARATLSSYIAGVTVSVLSAVVCFALATPINAIFYDVVHGALRGAQSPIVLPDIIVGLFSGSSPVLALLIALLIFGLAYMLTKMAFLYYPKSRAQAREQEINAMFPHAVTFLYAMSLGESNPLESFRSLSEHKDVYGEMSVEAETIVKGVDMLGMDLITSIREVTRTTPSAPLKNFLESMVNVMDSGGDISKFLSSRIEQYRDIALRDQRLLRDMLGMLAEVYVTGLVAGPLFIIVILFSIGMMQSSNIAMIQLLIYLLVPVGSLLFIGMLYFIGLMESSYRLSTTSRSLDSFGDIALIPEQTGRTVTVSGWEQKAKKIYERIYQQLWQSPVTILYVSVPIAVLLGAWLMLSHNTLFGIARGTEGVIVVCFMVAVVPLAILWELEQYKVRKMDQQIPEFLKRLASINESGLTIEKAIKSLIYSNLGVLKVEVKRIVSDLDWGAGLKEALIRFEHRINTLSIRRAITLTIRASDSAANIKDTLHIAASDAEISNTIKDERTTDMLIYLSIIYISFGVFLYVAFVLITTFLPAMAGASMATASAGGQVASAGFMSQSTANEVDTLTALLYQAVLIQGLFSGLVAGVMGEGSPYAGLKHTIIMMLVTYVAFSLFV